MNTCPTSILGKLSITLNASYDGKRVFSHHLESMEMAAGEPGNSESQLLDGLAAALRPATQTNWQAAFPCHINLRAAADQFLHGGDCLYGQALQDELLKQLMAPGADQLNEAERKASLQYVENQLSDVLQKHRGQFRAVLIDKLKRADDVQQSLKNLGQSADLIEAYVKLGLPKSLASNDSLHASIFGKIRLLKGSDIIRLVESDVSGEETGKLVETLTSRAVSLRNLLADLLKDPVVEPQPMIEETMKQLKTAYEKQQRDLPKVGMDDAWNDLRAAVSTLN